MKRWIVYAVLVAAVAFCPACALSADGEKPTPKEEESVEKTVEQPENRIRVEINENVLDFPDKATHLPQAIRDVASKSRASITFAFTGTDPAFSELTLGDFRVYKREEEAGKGFRYPRWVLVDNTRVDGSVVLSGKEMEKIASGEEVLREINIEGLPAPPGPLLLETTVTVETAPEGRVSVIDPPPLIIYP